MNTNTGEIREFPSAAAAKAAGFNRPIAPEQRSMVQGMTRSERIRWAAEVRASERDAAHRAAPRKKYKQRARVSR
ncbi:MAG: hypothetical protein IBJ10_01130 [Phycisphaerales bacterium]|nr:hypothetical protein [Phycisphaerales bacterium]